MHLKSGQQNGSNAIAPGEQMEPDEMQELSKEAKETGQKPVGLTTAIFAVFLALSTMLGHRMHTEEILIQTKANDQWAYYQAKTIRSHMYEANSEMAALIKGDAAIAQDFHNKSEDQRKGAEAVREKAEDLQKDAAVATRRAARFDASEIFFQVAIVLCSITLLTGARVYWLVSFISGAVGAIFLFSGFLIR